MPRKSDDIIKGFIGQIGAMIDARNRTLEINLKAYIDSVVKASEERIRKNMATKDDLKNFATKDDIKNMATKDDLKNFATKDDIKRLEQKIDKLDKITELQRQIDELNERIRKLEQSIHMRN